MRIAHDCGGVGRFGSKRSPATGWPLALNNSLIEFSLRGRASGPLAWSDAVGIGMVIIIEIVMLINN